VFLQTVLYEHESMEDLEQVVNKELKNLEDWFKTNRLSLNIAKSCYIPFHSLQRKILKDRIKIEIGGDEIRKV